MPRCGLRSSAAFMKSLDGGRRAPLCAGTSTTASTRRSARSRSTASPSRPRRRPQRRPFSASRAPTPPRPSLAPSTVPSPRAPVPLESPQLVEDARALAEGCNTLAELEAAIRGFDSCALKRTAKNTVFADGTPGAPVMIVGEAPGADEDRLGKPFVGVSGQLMDRMMATIGLTATAASTSPTSCSGGRPATARRRSAEQGMCLAFTRRHIELAGPRSWCWPAATAVKAVLDTTEGITRLRGKWTSYRLADGTNPDDADLPPRLSAAHAGRQAPELAGPSGDRQEAEGAGLRSASLMAGTVPFVETMIMRRAPRSGALSKETA